jgi:hypothetical protein
MPFAAPPSLWLVTSEAGGCAGNVSRRLLGRKGTAMKPVSEMALTELETEMGTLSLRVPSYPQPPNSPDLLAAYERLDELVHEVERRVAEEARSLAALRRMEEFHEEMGMGRLPADRPMRPA